MVHNNSNKHIAMSQPDSRRRVGADNSSIVCIKSCSCSLRKYQCHSLTADMQAALDVMLGTASGGSPRKDF